MGTSSSVFFSDLTQGCKGLKLLLINAHLASQPGPLSQMLSHQNYVWKSHEHWNIMVFKAMGWWRMHQALKVIRMSGVRS